MISAVWCLSANVGDMLTPYLIRKLKGEDAVYAQGGADYQHYILSGSVLNHANDKSIVWGAGIANWNDGVNPGARLLAVRGPISRQRALSCGAKCPPIYGDPAMVLPKLYTPKAERTHPIGIIPHYVDQFRAHSWWRGLCPVINVFQPVESFIEEVASCKAIISSSLHGIIIAHAYGIPAVWAKFSDSIGGDDTKYRDYYMSIEQDPPDWVDMRNGGKVPTPLFDAPKVNCEAFWNACPLR